MVGEAPGMVVGVAEHALQNSNAFEEQTLVLLIGHADAAVQLDRILLDEPSGGLDPRARRDLWKHLEKVRQESGLTVLVTTHIMEEGEFCDRLAIMMAGQILALGTPADVKRQTRSEENPEPTMEDAFVRLIESQQPQGPT